MALSNMISIQFKQRRFSFAVPGYGYYFPHQQQIRTNNDVQRQIEKPGLRRRRREKKRPRKSRDKDVQRVIGGAMLLLLFVAMAAIVIYFVYFQKSTITAAVTFTQYTAVYRVTLHDPTPFVAAFAVPTSPEFMNYESTLCNGYEEMYAALGQGLDDCAVQEIRNGSTVTDCVLFVSWNSTESASATDNPPCAAPVQAGRPNAVMAIDCVSNTTLEVMSSSGSLSACSNKVCGRRLCQIKQDVNGVVSAVCFCPTGFVLDAQNTTCQDQNQCASNPCLNGANCTDKFRSYSCVCAPGFTGVHCETEIDECSSTPCLNGATCNDYVNMYNCTCAPGYNETHCELEINECESNPCQNMANCTDSLNMFICNCTMGWYGTLCDQDIDECSSMPCLHGATCNDHVNMYNCTCASGYNGTHCEIEVNECASNPCQNMANCTDLVDMFICNCTTGWNGTLCGQDINECESAPCQNGATCNNTQPPGTYRCDCVPGYNGTNCEINIDECLGMPCRNGANCTDAVNGYNCSCTVGFTGIHCETDIDECMSMPCQNNGSCNNTIPAGAFECSCIPGINGTFCEIDIDECLSTPCAYAGNCTDQVNGYNCSCQPGSMGVHCETDLDECASDPCQQNGTCIDRFNGYNCTCPSRHRGNNCEIDTCMIVQTMNDWIEFTQSVTIQPQGQYLDVFDFSTSTVIPNQEGLFIKGQTHDYMGHVKGRPSWYVTSIIGSNTSTDDQPTFTATVSTSGSAVNATYRETTDTAWLTKMVCCIYLNQQPPSCNFTATYAFMMRYPLITGADNNVYFVLVTDQVAGSPLNSSITYMVLIYDDDSLGTTRVGWQYIDPPNLSYAASAQINLNNLAGYMFPFAQSASKPKVVLVFDASATSAELPSNPTPVFRIPLK